MKTSKQGLGVVVGRFQVPKLHAGHKALIEAAIAECAKVLIVVGSPGHGGPALTIRNPLDYETREAMIKKAYPKVLVAELRDERRDEDWSTTLDMTIQKHANGAPATLYVSRDSFRPYYHGEHTNFREVPAVPKTNGTALRKGTCIRDTEDFRRGVIYAAKQLSARRPRTFHTVDVAVVDLAWSPGRGESKGRVLVGYKPNQKGVYRFPGGFVSPEDDNTQKAALRELREETGMKASEATYVGNYKIPDWRYANAALFTDFFMVKWRGEEVKAADDLGALEWVTLEELANLNMTEGHEALAKALLAHVN